ncbi:MAG TPA: hypothetical protein VFR35_18295 [Actinoplanes sp.]|nr:hypothetical protein [Actinoplanes sp.]
MHGSRARSRVAESIDEVDQFAAELDRWFASAAELDALGQYRTQLDTLAAALRPGLRQNRLCLLDVDTGRDAGSVYDECRRADRRTVFLRRLWRWFTVRFDQRRDQRLRNVLRAADEVVWSCWAQTWQLTHAGKPGPAPLPYLDPQLSASATPRVDLPTDLVAVRDAALAAQVRAMPVPVIALPERVVWRPWWLVLLAHETGHHVQYELSPGADEPARDLVMEAAAGAGAGDDEQIRWGRWAIEIFADAYAAVMVGPAIAWAVDELELRGGDGLLRSPTPAYPPPSVRLALLAEATGDPGVAPPAGGGGPLADDVAALLKRVPAVSAALRDVPIGKATLATPAAALPGWRQSAAVWRRQLAGPAEPKPAATVEAARLCVAGGVAAWRERSAGDEAGSAELLRRRLLATLPECGPGGVRAGTVPAAGVVEAAARSVIDAAFSPAVEEVNA